MTLIADGLLAIATLAAIIYCNILAKKLHAFGNMDSGIGATIKELSTETQKLTATLSATRQVTLKTNQDIEVSLKKSDATIRKLELLIAATHDLTDNSGKS